MISLRENKESMADTSQGLAKRDIQTLANIFKRYASVQAVYLFGSHAEGRPRAGSDIDLAVVSRRGAKSPNKLDLLTDLARTGFCNIDILILDTNGITSDIVLAYEAVRLNRVIYQADDFERGTLYSKVVRQYLDFKPYLDVQREAYKGRILSGQG